MDNGSLKHKASTRQLHSSKPESSQKSLPNSGVFCDMLQAMRFSLTFSASEWCLFWRLLNVGNTKVSKYFPNIACDSDVMAIALESPHQSFFKN